MADRTGELETRDAAPADRVGEDPDATGIVIVGILGAILTFIVIVAAQAFFYGVQQHEIERKVYAEVPAELTLLRAKQLETLNSYRWVDEANGIVAIPIERAKELVLLEHDRRVRAAGGAAPSNEGESP